MASVVVHNGEYFERGKSWYVLFSLILIVLIIVSVIFENLFGAIILFLLVGGYILFALMRNKKISLRNAEQGLVIADKVLPWSSLNERSVELDSQSGEAKNIIIVSRADKLIFTLDDEIGNIKSFMTELNEQLPLADNVTFSFTERLIRKLKL